MKINSQFIIYLISITVITSCSKIDVISPVNFQKQLLSGTGTYQNSKHTWQLDSTRINGVNLALTPSEKNFKKTFSYDGSYSDTDNNTGVWEINTLNKLKETLLNSMSTIQDSTTYDIVSVNSVQLNLSKKLLNGQTAIYSFKIVN
jgi:hypothetical protein